MNFPVLVIPTDILGGNLDARSLLHFIALCGSNYLQSKTEMMSAYSINKIYLNINMRDPSNEHDICSKDAALEI